MFDLMGGRGAGAGAGASKVGLPRWDGNEAHVMATLLSVVRLNTDRMVFYSLLTFAYCSSNLYAKERACRKRKFCACNT